MTTRTSPWLLSALVVSVVVCGAAAGLRAQEDNFFPSTKKVGRAAVEFRDREAHVVAAYYYSQLNHDSRWLLIEAAVSTQRNLTIDREDIALLTPEGRRVPLASQERFSQDVNRVSLLLQNAQVTRHGVLAYFGQVRWIDEMRLFALRGGTVLTNFVTDRDHVARGDLFFESPTGFWAPGTYTLVIERDGVRAALPIELT